MLLSLVPEKEKNRRKIGKAIFAIVVKDTILRIKYSLDGKITQSKEFLYYFKRKNNKKKENSLTVLSIWRIDDLFVAIIVHVLLVHL